MSVLNVLWFFLNFIYSLKFLKINLLLYANMLKIMTFNYVETFLKTIPLE